MFNSIILTLFSVIFTTTILSQSITLNGTVVTPTGPIPGSCDANTFQTVGTANVNGTCIDMNTPGNFQQGAVWVCNTISLFQSFKLSFKANFGSNQATGDGIAFVLQGEGLNVLGGTGGGMGYAPGNPINCLGGGCPIDPSVAVEFDTYNGAAFGDNDINCNHSSMQVDGSTNSAATISGPDCLLPSGGSVVDGIDHDICITWNAISLLYNVYFDDALVSSYSGNIRNFFFSPASVYWGFTASSGGATQIHSICEVEMQTNVSDPSCICSSPNLIITDPAPFCGVGNITDASITAGSDAGTLTYWNNALCTNPVTNPNSLLNTGVFYIQLETVPGCITSEAVNLTVNNSITPTFDPIPFICVGEPVILPSTSLEGVSGTWSPALNNTVTTTYTFTPDPGECANATTTTTVQVRPAPTVDPIADIVICNGDIPGFTAVVSGLGTTINWSSLDGIFSNPTDLSTSFTPSISSGSAIITAIASSPICSITAQEIITVTINANNITPSFNPIADICSGDALTLPVTSTNSINGTWSPVIDNTLTTNYTFTPAPGQCASNASMTVVVVQASLGTDTQASCDTYTWIDGNTYTASNNSATWLLTNAAGCDSTVTLDLTITNSTTGTDTQTACDTYTWIDGNTYTSSNNSATVLLTNAAGCDSTVTLDLTIANSLTGTDTQTACDTYTWIDGNTYTVSNNSATVLLTNAAGCDSTVTLDLTITNSTTGTDNQTACDTYTWIDGNTYT
ncbi:MAG: hypothetical protein QNL43_02775, partial [Crocinitomicaceae bacterium]